MPLQASCTNYKIRIAKRHAQIIKYEYPRRQQISTRRNFNLSSFHAPSTNFSSCWSLPYSKKQKEPQKKSLLMFQKKSMWVQATRRAQKSARSHPYLKKLQKEPQKNLLMVQEKLMG